MPAPVFEHLTEIGRRIARARGLLLYLDFDGTLTHFQDVPAQVYLLPAVRETLRTLTCHERIALAIISGRTCVDLQARVGIDGAYYAGNHGLEISGPRCQFVEPTALASQEHVQKLADHLRIRLEPIKGAFVEDKGLSLSVHYRQAAPETAEEVRRQVHATLAGMSHPFQLTAGDKIYEIRPRLYWNKASAVNWIREQLNMPDALPIFLGDDGTDEDAFAALVEGITIKVGNFTSETAATYALEDPDEVHRFLKWLSDRICDRNPGRERSAAEV
jgi:trehalose 6-phosphate phosphatase